MRMTAVSIANHSQNKIFQEMFAFSYTSVLRQEKMVMNEALMYSQCTVDTINFMMIGELS